MKWNEMKFKYLKQWTANIIRDEGAMKLSESLKTNTTLTELNLWCDDKI